MSVASIDELIALVGRWQPDFAAKIEGASVAQLEAIEDHLGIALEPMHRAFLERMGVDSGGINGYGDEAVDLRVDALLEFLAADHGFDPRVFTLVGVSQDPNIPLLMFDRRQELAPPPLVRLGFGDGEQPAITPEHTSLLAMLSVFAYLKKCLPRFGWELHLESPGLARPRFVDCPPGRWLPRFAGIATELGFKPIANTGPWSVCAEGPGAAMMIYECPGYTPDIRIATEERRELVRLAEILTDNLELRSRPNSMRSPA